MLETRIGAFTVTRVEEMLTPGFDPAFLFPAIRSRDLRRGAAARERGIPRRRVRQDDVVDAELAGARRPQCHRDRHRLRQRQGCASFRRSAASTCSTCPISTGSPKRACGPADVTHVINTHLHVDHVGWNTVRPGDRWAPTFPERALLSSARRSLRTGSIPRRPARAPETDAGDRGQRAPGGRGRRGRHRAGRRRRSCPACHSRRSPAIRSGSSACGCTSQGASALFSGDVFHQPMQIVRPAWNSRFCEHQDIARVTRARVLDENADTGTVIFPSHFGTPHAGTIRRSGAGYRFNPLACNA